MWVIPSIEKRKILKVPVLDRMVMIVIAELAIVVLLIAGHATVIVPVRFSGALVAARPLLIAGMNLKCYPRIKDSQSGTVMLSQPSEYKHINLNTDGVAIIDGTTLKVRELALEHVAYGWSADQLHKQHPYLLLSQVHASLAYYFDHQSQLDCEIKQDLELVEKMSAEWQAPNAVIREKIKESR